MSTGFESHRQVKRRRLHGTLRHALLLAFAAGMLAWLLEVLGVTSAADANLRRLYYQIRGERTTAHDVVFVAMDETTVEAWGAPPWNWQRYSEMVSAIQAGKPRMIAFLEDRKSTR